METREVLADAFERVREEVDGVCDGLEAEALTWRPEPDANTIAWLLWHVGRCGDAQIMDLAGREQLWTAEGWRERFELPFEADDVGYGHTPEQVGRVRPDGTDLLVDYLDAVIDATGGYLKTVDADELDRVVDRRWEPPVTAGVRLVSVVNDQTQHVGQAAYVRGMYERIADT